MIKTIAKYNNDDLLKTFHFSRKLCTAHLLLQEYLNAAVYKFLAAYQLVYTALILFSSSQLGLRKL